MLDWVDMFFIIFIMLLCMQITFIMTLGVTSPDALPLSHRILEEPKATIKTMFFPALH